MTTRRTGPAATPQSRHGHSVRGRVESRLWWLVCLILICAIQFQPHPGFADGMTGPLSPLDTVDSRGIELSRFQLSTPDPWLNPAKSALINILTFFWDTYRWGIGITAYILDWTTQMEWVDSIVGPIDSAATNLRATFLAPVGGTRLGGPLITVALMIAGAAAVRMFWQGRRARGGAQLVQSVAAATLAVGMFAAPLALFITGTSPDPDGDPRRPPLIVARDAGRQLAVAAVSGDRIDPNAEPPLLSSILIDTFVRPVHQSINYGEVLDTDHPECAKVYDQALSEAQSSADLAEVHKALDRSSDCDDAFADHAENPSMSWLVPMIVFGSVGDALSLLVWIFIIFTWLSVLMLAWSALMLMFNTLRAILPGGTLMHALRDLIGVATSLLYLVVSMVMLGVIMAAIRATMGNDSVPLILRFLVAIVVLLAGGVLLIVVFVQHIRGRKTALQWLQDKLRQPHLKPSLTSKAVNWATSSAHGGPLGPDGQPRGGVASMLSRAAKSKAGRLAMTAAKAGGAIATGGTSAAATAVAAGTAKRRLASAAVKVGRVAYRAKQNYQAGRAGVAAPFRGRSRIPLLGQLGDTTALAAGRAHTHLANAAKVARSAWDETAFDHDTENPTATTGNAKLDAHLLHLGHRLRHTKDHPALSYTPPGDEITETKDASTTQTRRGNTTTRDVRASAYRHHLQIAEANVAAATQQREDAGNPTPVTARTYLGRLRASDKLRRQVARSISRQERASHKDDRKQARIDRRDHFRSLITEGHTESLVHHESDPNPTPIMPARTSTPRPIPATPNTPTPATASSTSAKPRRTKPRRTSDRPRHRTRRRNVR